MNRHKNRAIPSGHSYTFTWPEALGHGLGGEERPLQNLGVELVRVSEHSRYVTVNFIAPDAPPELQNITGWAVRAVIGEETHQIEECMSREVRGCFTVPAPRSVFK